jgi:hypothetical protein
MPGIRTYATTGDGLKVNKLIAFPAMPVITLAGPEGNSMGNPLERRRLFEANSSGAGDSDDGDDPLLVGEAPPEDDPPEELLIVPTEEDVEEFLAGYTYTEEQAAWLELAQSGEEGSEAAWASLVDSLTASFALHMIDQFDPF